MCDAFGYQAPLTVCIANYPSLPGAEGAPLNPRVFSRAAPRQRTAGKRRTACEVQMPTNCKSKTTSSLSAVDGILAHPRARAAAHAHTRAGEGMRAPPQGASGRVPEPCGECLDSSNAAIPVHKIWRARPYLYRAIRARRMDSNGTEYVPISAHRGDDENPGDARKVCAY